MSRRFPQSRGNNRLAEVRSGSGDFAPKIRFTKFDLLGNSNRRVLLIDRHQTNLRKSLYDGAKSALLSQDNDLALILQEVDHICKNLKSNPPDTEALTEALHRSVLCAIKRSLLDRELRSLALTDDLTSLYNRRAFYALATQQLRVMRRKAAGLLLFFADVDHLKNINDTFGHREGDLALARTADALARTFRNSDIIARIAGDEFAVLALEASSQDQDAILRRLERNLGKTSAEETRYKLSLSIGAAKYDPKHSVSLGDLLTKADLAMYENKSIGPKKWTSRA